MTTPTLSATNLLKYIQVQLAAETLFGYDANESNQEPGIPTNTSGLDVFTETMLKNGNQHASKFNAFDAKTFAEQWKVIDHLPNTKSGFSGTLFIESVSRC